MEKDRARGLDTIATIATAAGALALSSGRLEIASTLLLFSGISLVSASHLDRLRPTRKRRSTMKNEYQGQNPAPTKIAFENALHNVDQSKKTEEEIAAERKREEQTVEYQYQQQLAKQPKELTHAEFLAKLKAEDPRYAKAPQVEGGKNVVETMEVKQADVTLTPVSSDVQG